MTLSTFAYIIGLTELLVGLPFLLYPDKTAAWLSKAMKEDLWMRTIGAFMLFLCFIVLKENPGPVDGTVSGLVRLLAWLGLIKGIIYAWWPHFAGNWRKTLLQKKSVRPVWGLLAIIVGALLIMAGNLL